MNDQTTTTTETKKTRKPRTKKATPTMPETTATPTAAPVDIRTPAAETTATAQAEGFELVRGNTYPCRLELRRMGGEWDKAAYAWRIPAAQVERARALVASMGPKVPFVGPIQPRRPAIVKPAEVNADSIPF
jgi:hypothetical protein